MDKCQQFIDKVSELSFLNIKEWQVNTFNRLLLKKQGNITWFRSFPPVNLHTRGVRPISIASPQAESAAQAASVSSLVNLPQTANTQASSFWEDSASQVASTSSPQTFNSQAGSYWEDSTSQANSASSPQTVRLQAVSTDPQVVSTPASQAGSGQKDSTSQGASTSSPQTVNSQACSSREDSTSQASSTSSPKQLVHMQAALTLRQPAFLPLPRKQLDYRQSVLTPRWSALLLPRQVVARKTVLLR